MEQELLHGGRQRQCWNEVEASLAQGSSHSHAAQIQQASGDTSRLLKDLQGLGVHLLSAPQFRVQSVHLDQAEVGTEVHEQADEGS